MRLVCMVSGFLDMLARWLALHRSLEDRGRETVELLAYGRSRSVRRYATMTSSSREEYASVVRELEEVSAALSDERGATDAEWEACLPQVTRLLLDFGPRSSVPTSVRRRTLMAYDPRSREYFSYSTTIIDSEGSAAEGGQAARSSRPEDELTLRLTSKLREALVARCGRSSQLGLQACWLLQDALPQQNGEWGLGIARDCWRATAGASEDARESAALVASLVRISEALAKVDRSKRRDKARLRPLLEAMNSWLAPRAAGRRGVRVPLCPLAAERQIRVLRLDVDSCEVMPSRARAPTLLYCEALQLAEEDPVFKRAAEQHPALNVGSGAACDVVAAASSREAQRLVSRVYAPAVWEEREAILRRSSPYARWPGWRLASFLVKADDELAREQLAMQFVRLARDILAAARVDAWLRPYAVVCAGKRAGLVETLADAKSVTHVKRALRDAAGVTDLATYFDLVYGETGTPTRTLASLNFAKSLAAYSLVCYALDLKDRHNGNILLDRDGHLIHIDFGYMLGLSPGNIGFETAPFKLTMDYVNVMGGFDSPAFDAFLRALAAGAAAFAEHLHHLQTLLVLFFGDTPKVHDLAHALFLRFAHLRNQDHPTALAFASRLVHLALSNDRTKQYDWYQWKTNGIIM
mmetsp:Transcript_2012/g.6083  ORF Transcript_2012/g.6083 Transcript_2012/m.6083 type:complete len:639 (+) Transcript_2012:95-2011(+)